MESLSLAHCPISDEGLEGAVIILIHFNVKTCITLELLSS